MSLESAGAESAPQNPLGGAQALENRFENLWQGGAFDSQDPREAAQLRAERGQASAPEQQQPVNGKLPAQQPTQAVPEQQTEQPEEGPEYADLDDYLTRSNIERESFMSMPVNVKIDGKTERATLADLVKNYGLERHFQAKSIAFAEQQRAWEGEREKAKQALGQHLNSAETLAKLAHQQLLGEYQGIDWNKLRMEDPIQWSVRNQEFQNRANQIQQHLAQVQHQQQQLAQQAEQERLAKLPQEREKMLDARPEWRDDTKFQAARAEMTGYARKLGYSDAEIGSIFDHRFMLILHDAARFAQLQAQAPQAAKRVRAAPQMANPGARIQRDPNQAALSQAKERWKRNPRDQDAAVALFDRLA
jgi:hypothetical protein